MESRTCNKCGKTTHFESCKDMKDILTENNKFHTFSTNCMYGSEFKIQKINFMLCENCLSGFISTFEIPISHSPI